MLHLKLLLRFTATSAGARTITSSLKHLRPPSKTFTQFNLSLARRHISTREVAGYVTGGVREIVASSRGWIFYHLFILCALGYEFYHHMQRPFLFFSDYQAAWRKAKHDPDIKNALGDKLSSDFGYSFFSIEPSKEGGYIETINSLSVVPKPQEKLLHLFKEKTILGLDTGK